MKKRILLFLGFIFISANVASAQIKSVTNVDLEKFRLERVQADEEYRKNYRKLGLPSPEELKEQREQNRQELAELSGQLRKENSEREQRQREEEYRQAQIMYLRNNSSQSNQGTFTGNDFYPSGYFSTYPSYGYSGGYYDNYYYYNNYKNSRFGGNRGFGRGGNYYDSVPLGTVFPSQGIRINTGGVRIGVTGGNRFPARIRNPR